LNKTVMHFSYGRIVSIHILFRLAQGHGVVTKPLPRMVQGKTYCAWCVGEHQPVSNPSGSVHRDARPSSPCMGSQRGDPHYTPDKMGGYRSSSGTGGPFVAGKSFEANVALDADHNGDARWSFCPHFEEETEECFQKHPLTDFIDVHSYWDASNTNDHWKSGQYFPQTVQLPASMKNGLVTLRWLWICKYTDEIFLSCIDADITGGDSSAPPTPIQPTQAPKPPTQGGECLWTDPPGRKITRTARDQKTGRTCWDFEVQGGTTVYYQSNTDVYHKWTATACCERASSTWGSAVGGPPNIVKFKAPQHGGMFGFCECTAWDPTNPGTSCAGQATAANMVCPVQGDSAGMCTDSSNLDDLPVQCGGGDAPNPEPRPVPGPDTTQAPPQPTGPCSTEWQQCGGQGWNGPLCCQTGSYCDRTSNPLWYHQCKPGQAPRPAPKPAPQNPAPELEPEPEPTPEPEPISEPEPEPEPTPKPTPPKSPCERFCPLTDLRSGGKFCGYLKKFPKLCSLSYVKSKNVVRMCEWSGTKCKSSKTKTECLDLEALCAGSFAETHSNAPKTIPPREAASPKVLSFLQQVPIRLKSLRGQSLVQVHSSMGKCFDQTLLDDELESTMYES